ncbi:putative peroxisomal membrane protein [Lupinus albus]|uniref:Peroxisomal membrane protein PEX14 n=1 Tax=Lupinus albus TaxID=3870 RepID=A0A6A4PSC8_LUPAL|nr:putative peroxisomal membrane protein [Lupinus albus]
MATQSSFPPISTHQTTGTEIVGPTNEKQQNVRDDLNESSMASDLVNSEPMREEQVQNAVKFLSHPKVRGSPVIHRRSFLEKKGLTKEEIDEAFRRVPDSPSSVQTAGVNQDGQLAPSLNIQQQSQPQALQPGVSANTGVTTLGTLSRFSFHWSHALIAVGLLVASGAGTAMLIKNSILPWLKSWIRDAVLKDDQSTRKDLKPTSAEEAAQAAKAAALAAADMAKASQEILASKSEDRRYFVEVVSLLDKQVQEMKLMTNAVRRLEASDGVSVSKREDRQVTQTSSKIQQLIVNGKEDNELHSVSSSSQPASAPHPKSYMEIMAMIQRGEKPSNIRDIDDSPPNPNQQPSKPRLAPRTKPWEAGQVQVSGKDLNSSVQDNGYNPVPWWQTKNVRISEIDNETDFQEAPNGAPSSQQPVQHVWVPPQPPPILMPDAAEAIRHTKSVVPTEKMLAHSSDRAVEGSGINSLLRSGELQDHEVNYENK